jgi:transglutaminase-like putative cysteine protease
MHYSVRHRSLFTYSDPVRESVMELRMQPRSDGQQMLRNFQIITAPRSVLHAYTDHLGNAVYHFNVLKAHSGLNIEVQAAVDMSEFPALPNELDELEWDRFNGFNLRDEHYDFLEPSKFACPSAELIEFCDRMQLSKPQGDPLTALLQLNALIYGAFDYELGVTQVHSPITHALKARRGVCQDFAHIMIAIARHWKIPARYVSGYLFHRDTAKDRSAQDASHAWMEAWLPSLGWIGFDPTNNILARERHIRVAIGRDYADVPPTRGTFKGDAATELSIAVGVHLTPTPVRHEEFLRVTSPMKPSPPRPPAADLIAQQQQQQ